MRRFQLLTLLLYCGVAGTTSSCIGTGQPNLFESERQIVLQTLDAAEDDLDEALDSVPTSDASWTAQNLREDVVKVQRQIDRTRIDLESLPGPTDDETTVNRIQSRIQKIANAASDLRLRGVTQPPGE